MARGSVRLFCTELLSDILYLNSIRQIVENYTRESAGLDPAAHRLVNICTGSRAPCGMRYIWQRCLKCELTRACRSSDRLLFPCNCFSLYHMQVVLECILIKFQDNCSSQIDNRIRKTSCYSFLALCSSDCFEMRGQYNHCPGKLFCHITENIKFIWLRSFFLWFFFSVVYIITFGLFCAVYSHERIQMSFLFCWW